MWISEERGSRSKQVLQGGSDVTLVDSGWTRSAVVYGNQSGRRPSEGIVESQAVQDVHCEGIVESQAVKYVHSEGIVQSQAGQDVHCDGIVESGWTRCSL